MIELGVLKTVFFFIHEIDFWQNDNTIGEKTGACVGWKLKLNIDFSCPVRA